MAKMWSEVEIRNLIQQEVSVGTTMNILSESIASGSLATGVQAIVTAANAQVNHLTAQAQSNSSEIARVLEHSRTFVEQTRVDSEASKATLAQELEAMQSRFRDLVSFVDGVPGTVAKLEAQLEESKGKLKAVTDWCADNDLATVPVTVVNLQAKVLEIQTLAASRFAELATEISVTRSAVGHGSGTGGQSSTWVEKDRNVFDVRDYKLSDLGLKPTTARWKKWRRDLEGFIDTIGPSWKGTSGLLR